MSRRRGPPELDRRIHLRSQPAATAFRDWHSASLRRDRRWRRACMLDVRVPPGLRGASVLLLHRARFPRDKPCGGGVTGRWRGFCPSRSLRWSRTWSRWCACGSGTGRGSSAAGHPLVQITQRPSASMPSWPSRPSRRARSSLFGPRSPQSLRTGPASRSRPGASAFGPPRSWAPTASTARPPARWDWAGTRLSGSPWRGTCPGRSSAVGTGAAPCSSWASSRAATAGSSRKATTPTSGSAAGSGRDRARAHLRALCAAHGVAAGDLEGVRGYRLPLRAPRSTLARGRTAAIGDAAGFVHPVSGDGTSRASSRGSSLSRCPPLLACRAEASSPTASGSHGSSARTCGHPGRQGRPRPLPAHDLRDRAHPHRSGAWSTSSCGARSTTWAGRAVSPARRSRPSRPSPAQPETWSAPTGQA